MSQLAFRKYARFGSSDKDLGDRVETEEEEGFEGREGVAEVYQSRDEDKEIEDEGSNIA